MRTNEDSEWAQAPRNHNLKSTTNKSSHSTTSLLSTRDIRPLISRETNELQVKELSRNKIEEKEPAKVCKQYPSKGKEHSSSSKSETLIKQPSNHENTRNAENSHGISINVNIQNLITPKHLIAMQACGLQKEEKVSQEANLGNGNNMNYVNNGSNGTLYENKNQRKPSIEQSELSEFEFQCNEELTYIKHRSTSPRPATKPSMSRYQKEPKLLWPRNPQTPKHVNPAEMIKTFESEMEQINENWNTECLIYLDNRQQVYQVNPKYIELYQPNLRWRMRAQMVEWMMQVSSEYELKRETFHISVNLVDRYLQKEKNLSKGDFQLVGAAVMFIASKNKEFEPKTSTEFVKATGNAFSTKKLKEMEKKICTTLEYKINPPTLFRWANRLMTQWDSYIKSTEQNPQYCYGFCPKMYFKEFDEESYVNFRVLMQLIDCSTMDIQTAEYSPKLLVCAFMYLYLGRELKLFNNRDIVHNFPQSSLYLLDEDNPFNTLFNEYLTFTFGFSLIDLLPTIQYCASYISLPANVESPSSKNNPEDYENMELEEYCSFQTFDPNMYLVVTKRFRDIYI